MSATMTVEELSAEEIAELAAVHPAFVAEEYVTLIREADLPDDWVETTIECYSIEAPYYALAKYPHVAPMKAAIDDLAAREMAAIDCSTVLDMGVGDGHRLGLICTAVEAACGRAPRMYGIELSDEMIELAQRRGVTVVKGDIREGIPDFGLRFDVILYLSGDFGYIMDPVNGEQLRRRALDNAYQALSAGGKLVMELVSPDPRGLGPEGEDVYYFSRAPVIDLVEGGSAKRVKGPTTWQYVRTFERAEIERLVEATRFDLEGMSTTYIVRDSHRRERIGEVVRYEDTVPEESYRLVVVLRR